MAGPSGLHNINIGGISVPAPSFVIMHRGNSENPRLNNPDLQESLGRLGAMAAGLGAMNNENSEE